MNLPQEEKAVWEHNDIWKDEPFHFTAVMLHRNYKIGLHTHAFYEINVVLRGTGVHWIESNRLPCGRGDVYVIPPHVKHGYEEKENLDVFHVLLHDRFMHRYDEELHATEGFRMLFEIEPALRVNLDEKLFLALSENELTELEPLQNTMLSLSALQYTSDRILLNSLALAYIVVLCRRFIAHHPQKSKTSVPNSYHIMKSIEWLQQNYMNKITADDMIAKTYLSRATYYRLFKKMFSVSPNEYLLNYRLGKAKEMLQYTDKTVSDIALDCGFFDPSHFIKNFERAEGITPARYRQQFVIN